MRDLLVIGELALAFVLAVGAGLLGKSLLRLVNVDPGFDPRNVLTLNTYVYGARYQKPEAELNYYEQALARLRATPAIESVAMTSSIPFTGFDRSGFHIRDRRRAHDSEDPSADRYSVTPDYFKVMRIPLKRGRLFTAQDNAAASKVAVISEACAREQFPNRDSIGRQIQLGGRDDGKPWMTIVGIVGDVRQYGLDTASNIAAYIPQAQDLSFGYALVARTATDPLRLEKAARAAFLAEDPTLPVFQVQSMRNADSLWPCWRCLAEWLWLWRQWAFTVWSPARRARARGRWESAWRWARNGAMCCLWCCGRRRCWLVPGWRRGLPRHWR
jgi:putative ABC transport system permease protein